MNETVISLFRDPLTRQALRLDPSTDTLVNAATGVRYPIDGNGTVHFLDRAAVAGRNRLWMKWYDFLAPFFDALATFWSWFLGGEERCRRKFLDHIEVGPDDNVLEVAVGTGSNLHLLPPQAHYFGLDISAGMLARCHRNLQRWHRDAVLVHGEAEHLPFADDSFDVVLQVSTIAFFNDPGAALAEMVRVAKPGAQLMVVDGTERAYRMKSAALRIFGGPACLGPPVELLPKQVGEVSVRIFWKDMVYCLTFRKPAH
jgi:ubiquinone/menaquinone biosynthesis C-methylase UbiE